ncbi:hypothetical protein FKB34_06230 [Glycocaulis profundi]|nr:hypothetical protein FKB34_06230 [Glycocaulis profundi]
MDISPQASGAGALGNAAIGKYTNRLKDIRDVINGNASDAVKVEAFSELQQMFRFSNGQFTKADFEIHLEIRHSDFGKKIQQFANKAASQMNARVFDMDADEHWQLGVLDTYSMDEQRMIMVGMGWDSAHDSLESLRALLTRQHEEDMAMRAEAKGEDSVELSETARALTGAPDSLDLSAGEIDTRSQAALNIMTAIVENVRAYQRLGSASRQDTEASALEAFIDRRSEARRDASG